MDLSIIIPTYNEKGIIEEVIKESKRYAEKVTNKYEIIVLDDCSNDGTRDLLKKLKYKYAKLKLIWHKKNTGYGKAILDLFYNSRGDYVLNIPGDNQIPASNLIKFWKYKDKYDIIIGYRKNRKDNLYRVIQSYFYNLILSLIVSKRLYDVNSSKLIKKEIIDKIKLETKSSYAEPSAELCLKAIKKGYKVHEIVIKHKKRTYGKNRTGNKVFGLLTTFVIVRDLFNLWNVIRKYK